MYPTEKLSLTSTPAPRRLLIADDDDALAGLLRMIFEAEGFLVELALNGAMLTRAAFTFQPDLIITDHDMPFATGLEVVRLLRTDARTAQVPIILMTGRPTLEGRPVAELVAEVGISAFLTKPFDLSSLLALADGVLNATVAAPQ